ncbi:DNA-directed RNA polymerases IV and V subunit 2 [Olea europaea subsp. europaea]|uniref:DNA-directed RNA polymerase n=1 Tax=Olea europaea subsp. europaea TaxID=158383 RepID=A0A8S0V2R0_OLEEU|nr:DNA-directed RNA polymerases IV and V subunit 2 [Olea europaea subsp. europaea]
MKLVPKVEQFMGGEKFMTVYFAVIEIPIWIMFFALGSQNDREIVNLIRLGTEDCAITNVLLASIHDADKQCEGFRKSDKAILHIEKLIKSCQFPTKESIEECISNYLFPNLKSIQQRARFLANMVKYLLEGYTGSRKADRRDDFRSKRLELYGELPERELRVHIKHAERRMVRAMQRDLYRDQDVQSIEHYMDASIITNDLSRAFSTEAWLHPFKRMERISGVVVTLRQTNPLQTTVDTRKTRQLVSYTRRVGDARYRYPSHWGKICFLNTSDGENCGLVKNLSTLGLVSTCILEQDRIVDKWYECGLETLLDDTSTALNKKDKVFVGGDWVGMCTDSTSLVAKLDTNVAKWKCHIRLSFTHLIFIVALEMKRDQPSK